MEVADGSRFQRDRRIVFVSSHFVPSFDLFRLEGMVIRAMRDASLKIGKTSYENRMIKRTYKVYKNCTLRLAYFNFTLYR